MFDRGPDGVEVYFNWPARTARIVPNQGVRNAISRRDNICRSLVGVGLVAGFLLKDTSPTLVLLLLAAFLGAFLERSWYLSRLPKVGLNLTTAQIDEAYIRERGVAEGVALIVAGALFAGGLAWAAFTLDDMPAFLFMAFMLFIVVFTAVAYVGIRIVFGKTRKRSRRRLRARKMTRAR